MKPTVDREFVTPKMAVEYLESNTHNSHLVDKRVNTLVAAILNGEWRENGEAIKFNGDGTLIDGQHRLAAIIKAKKGVHTLVVRGLPTESQETIDIGASRTVGNMLSLRGHPNANNKAAVGRLLWVYGLTGELLPYLSNQRLDPTPQQIIAVVESTPQIDEWIAFGKRFTNHDRALRLTATMVSAFAIVATRNAPQEDVEEFLNQIQMPKNETDPPALLRKRLLASSPVHNPMSPRMKTALLIKAWNLWASGVKVNRLTWRPGGTNAEDFPKIQGMDAEA